MDPLSNKKKIKKNSRGSKKPSTTLPSEYVRFTDKSSFKLTVDLLESLWKQTSEAGLIELGHYPHISIFIPSKSNPNFLFKFSGYLRIEKRNNPSKSEK